MRSLLCLHTAKPAGELLPIARRAVTSNSAAIVSHSLQPDLRKRELNKCTSELQISFALVAKTTGSPVCSALKCVEKQEHLLLLLLSVQLVAPVVVEGLDLKPASLAKSNQLPRLESSHFVLQASSVSAMLMKAGQESCCLRMQLFAPHDSKCDARAKVARAFSVPARPPPKIFH